MKIPDFSIEYLKAAPLYLLLTPIMIVLFSCGDDDPATPLWNGEKRIIAFDFKADQNDLLNEDVVGIIDHDHHNITVNMPNVVILERWYRQYRYLPGSPLLPVPKWQWTLPIRLLIS